jgi:hypothetical protein
MNAITVREVLENALPSGTELLAGQAALAKKVSWAIALRLRGGLAGLEPGSIALINLETLRLMPASPSAAQAVQARGRADVAAVVLRGTLEAYQVPMTRLMAERAEVALLQLPAGKGGNVAAVEEAVNSYLSKQRGGREPYQSGRAEPLKA